MRWSFLVSTRQVIAWRRLLALYSALLSVHADSVTLLPVADTTLFETNPGNNLGKVLNLVSGTTLGPPNSPQPYKSRAAIKFNLASRIPSGVTVTSATVRVSVVRVSHIGGVD